MIKKQVWILACSAGILMLAAAFIWGFSVRRSQLTICDIQGNGEVSPYTGNQVNTRGLVSSNRPDLDPAGFFLLDPDCGIPEGSSAGVFVQIAGSSELVHPGDEVHVQGTVVEVNSETRLLSSPEQIQIVSLGNPLPRAVDLSVFFQSKPGLFSYERWEGQSVAIGSGEVIGPYLGGGVVRYLPDLDPPENSQLICMKDASITLGLLDLDRSGKRIVLETGSTVKNLTGFLRQNTSGYAIQTVPDQGLEIISPIQIMDENKSGLYGQAAFSGTGTNQPDTGKSPATPPGTLTPTFMMIPTSTWYPVELLITELLPNPEGKEPQGEWLEIYNPKSFGQLLTGIKVGDETSPSGKEGVLRFPDGYYIEAKEVLVIARQAVEFKRVYGFLPDFEFEDSIGNVPDLLPYDAWGRSSVQFSNSGDEVILLDPWDQVVDSLAYGKGYMTGFSNPPDSPAEGNSLERYPPEADRDRGGDWRERANPSPGRLDRTPPTQAASNTPNPSVTVTPLLIPTQTASPSTTPSPDLTATVPQTPSSINPTTTEALTASPTPTPEGSPISQVTMTSPSVTASLISRLTSTPTDVIEPSSTVAITDTPTALAVGTYEVSITPVASPSPLPSSTIPPESTAINTPLPSGTTVPDPSITPTLVQSLGLVLNEIHADPDRDAGDANADGVVSSDDDEFIELVNAGDRDLDLSGWQIADAVRPRFIFSDGSILKAGCALVVFGGGEPAGEFGGSEVFLASSLGLNNSGDSIIIQDEKGVEQIRIRFGPDWGEDQSLTLLPDLAREHPMVLHSEIPEAQGALFSPGTRVDGSHFQGCQKIEEPP